MNEQPQNKLGFIRTEGSDGALHYFPCWEINTKHGEPGEFVFMVSETKKYKYVLQEVTDR